MRISRSIVVAMSALEAFLAGAIGLAIPLLPLSLMWVTRFDNGLGWDVYWRASADIWLLGHGVDVLVTLDPALAASLGVSGTDAPFLVTLAPLAFALITVLLGVRLGRRAVEAGTTYIGPTTAIITFEALAVLVAFTADHPAVSPSLWQSLLFPGAIFATGVIIGARGEVGRSGGRAERLQESMTRWANGLPQSMRAVTRLSVAGGGIAVTGVIGIAAVTFAVMLIANFATIISLYEGLQGGVAGSLAITAIQLLFMPVFVMWAASWLVGPGFAIGTGSSVTPIGTQLGPVPSLPVLGALPPAHLAYGFIGLVVPVVAGFVAGYAVRGRSATEFSFADERTTRFLRTMTTLATALIGGTILGLFAWFASGAMGPGRLVDVGPDPIAVGLWFALELLVAVALGMVAPRPRRRSR